MKKISFICMAFLAGLGLTSCSDDYTSWASPQHSDPENAITIDGFSATGVDTIKLADVTTDEVQVFNLNLGELPEGYTYASSSIEITPATEDGVLDASASTLTTNIDVATGAGKVSTEEFTAAVKKAYGAAPYARNLNGRVLIYATTTEGNTVLINAGTVTIIAVPDAPVIASEYWYVGQSNNWKGTDKTYLMSNGGGDVYENPVFTVTVPAVGGQNWFKLVYGNPANDDLGQDANATAVGPSEGNGNNGMSGSTVSGLNNGIGAFVVDDSDCKYIRITFDALNQTYTIEKLNFPEYIYEAGDNNGWGSPAPYALVQGNGEEGVYYGAFYLPEMSNGFKFRSTFTDWPADDATTHDITDGGFNLGADANNTEGVLWNNGWSGNLNVSGAGFYWLVANAKDLTWEAHQFQTLGLIGDATPGSWSTDTELTYDADGAYWYANNVVFSGGNTTFKIRSDAAWNGENERTHVDFGGTTSALVKGGDNIPSPEAGTYNVKVYLQITEEGKAPYIELEKVN